MDTVLEGLVKSREKGSIWGSFSPTAWVMVGVVMGTPWHWHPVCTAWSDMVHNILRCEQVRREDPGKEEISLVPAGTWEAIKTEE